MFNTRTLLTQEKKDEEEKPEPEPEKEESAEPEEDHDKPKEEHGDGGGDKHKVEDIDEGISKMMKYGTAEVFKGTIYPREDFSAESAAETLENAMSGLGTDEQPIIDVASNISNSQRQEVVKVYKTMFGKDLIEELLSELTGNFEEAILALFQPRTYYDAWTLNKAMSGPGTKDMVLIELLCTRSNAEIQEICECYEKHFEKTLEQDILDDTSGYFKRLLVSCLQANRDELTEEEMERVLSEGPGCVIDEGKAKEEAEKLYQAGEGKIGTEEDTFLQIMSLRHFYQLRATFDAYKEVSGKDILEAVIGEFTGDEEDGFKAVVMCARNRPEYFADRLYNSMKGAGTDDSTLIRVIVSRSEIDLQNVKEVFEKKYGKTLLSFVEDDTSGDYKRLLASIVGS
ncbi:annexin A7-like isoform X2 [Liolophura sinensis]|uniref:annexin A7-like isoform X2 n=1 Tax=Liolophura sinensis TaxID=3198878 RepID=UPI003159081E